MACERRFEDNDGVKWNCARTLAHGGGCSPFSDLPEKSPANPIPTGFGVLEAVFRRALEQAALGKGRERHAAEGEAFDEQQIVKLGAWLGSNHFEVGQAVKKAIESARLPKDRAVAELLGAINYLAAAVIVLERS